MPITLDWSISLGNIFTAVSALIGCGAFFYRLHKDMSDRVARVEDRLGGDADDPPISQQVAVLHKELSLRHEENVRRLNDLRALVINRPRPWDYGDG